MNQKVEAASGSAVSYVANGPIVGIWIEVEGGGSGWANITAGRGTQRVYWNCNTRGRRFKAHIGVGGDPNNWGRTVKTGWKNDGSGIILNAYGIPGIPGISWSD